VSSTPTENGWQPIETIPTGVRVQLRREDCPGYDTTGVFDHGRFDMASYFIRHDMQLFTRPTQWRRLP